MAKSKLVDEIGSFTVVPNWVVDMGAKIGPDALALYIGLRYFGEGAFPSYDTLQEKTGLTRRRIALAIRALESNGLLERRRRFGASTVYTLKSSISTAGALVEAPISTDAGLSLVQGVYTNKTQLTISEEEEAKPTPLIHRLYHESIGPLYSGVMATLAVMEERYTAEWLTEAFNTAAMHNARNLAYVTAVLKSWETHGFKTDTREKHKREYPPRKKVEPVFAEEYR